MEFLMTCVLWMPALTSLWNIVENAYSQKLISTVPFSLILIKQCLGNPFEALYGGGIVVNPEFNYNIEGWKAFGEGEIEERLSKEGNRFIVAHSRKHPSDSFSQKVQVEEGKIYSFSGKSVVLVSAKIMCFMCLFVTWFWKSIILKMFSFCSSQSRKGDCSCCL